MAARAPVLLATHLDARRSPSDRHERHVSSLLLSVIFSNTYSFQLLKI